MEEKITKNVRKKKEITCFRCKKTGHYSNECKEELPKIPDRWIPLVNQSTLDLFTNKKLLKSIHDAKKDLSMYCNAGMTTVNKIRDLPWYGMVWYYETVLPT